MSVFVFQKLLFCRHMKSSRSHLHLEYSRLDHLHGAAAQHQLDLGLVLQRLEEQLLRLLAPQGFKLLFGQVAKLFQTYECM